jgi:hypothetical protein
VNFFTPDFKKLFNRKNWFLVAKISVDFFSHKFYSNQFIHDILFQIIFKKIGTTVN